MCIAILTTGGKQITGEVFQRCWKNNAHGVGFAYVDSTFDNKVVIDKGWMTADLARKRYHEVVEKFGANPILIHFRAATVGGIDTANCHPFNVKGGAMIHNGTFWRDQNAVKSDSRQLAEIMHNELTYDNLTKHKAEFDKAFGYNRVAFLFDEGKHVIFSEDYDAKQGKYGQWNDGIWYSNGGWMNDYGGYYGDDEATREISELDQSLWGRWGNYGKEAI